MLASAQVSHNPEVQDHQCPQQGATEMTNEMPNAERSQLGTAIGTLQGLGPVGPDGMFPRMPWELAGGLVLSSRVRWRLDLGV